MKRPIVYVFISLLLALILFYISFKLIFIAFFILFIILEKKQVKEVYRLAFILLFLMFSFYLYYYYFSYEKELSYKFEKQYIEANVWEVNQNHIVLKDYRLGENYGKYKILIYTKDKFNVGDRVYGKIHSKAYKEYFNEGRFDYKRYNKAKGIIGVYTADLKIKGGRIKYSLKRILARYRDNLANTIKLNMPKNQSILIAIILGIKTFRDLSDVRTAGIIHIFAISGMHLAIVTAMIYRLSILFSPNIRTRTSICIVFVILYLILTGMHPSTVRAAAMIIIYLMSKICLRFYDKTSALMFAFIIMILYNPYSLYDIGFILSYSAILGIFYIRKIIIFSDSDNYIKGVINTIFGVWLAIFPIIVVYYNEINIYSVLANFFVLPLLPVIILLGMLALISPIILSKGMLYIVAFLIDYILNISEFISSFPYSNIFIHSMGIAFIIFYFSCFYFYKKNKKVFIIMLIFIFVLFSITSERGFSVDFLDIDNGDCAIIRDRGEVMLIDGGGIPFKKGVNQGIKVLLPYLKYNGINKINNVIVTHSDFDHIYGIIEIIDKVKIDRIILSDFYRGRDVYLMDILEEKALKHGVEIDYVKNEESLKFSKGKFIFYTPYNHNSEVSANKASLITMLEIYDKKFLFLGDCEKSEEKYLLDNYSFEIEGVDVLKVAHHGSKTSSLNEFLLKVNPTLSIISSGRKNRFNHPNADVVKRLEMNSNKVLQTAKRGQISISLGKNNIRYKTYLDE